jgi:hypothetical protein
MIKTSLPGSNVVKRARDMLSQHAHFRGRTDKFEFECHGGVLVVHGSVPTFYLKQLLQDALKHMDGIQIDNRVDVVATTGVSGASH